MKLFFLLLALTFTLPLQAQTSAFFCQSPKLESLPILADGRVKPFLVHSQERIKYLTDKTSFEGKKASELYCLLSFSAFGLKDVPALSMRIDHPEAKKILGLETQSKSIPYSEALGLRLEVNKGLRPNGVQDGLQKELQKILSRLSLYESVTAAEDWTVASAVSGKVEWSPLAEALKEESIATLAKTYDDPFGAFFEQSKAQYLQHASDRYLLELKFAKMHVFAWAMAMVFISLFALSLSKKWALGFTLTALTWALQIAAVICRVLISGRAPVTNMYETVMFSGLGALTLGLIIAAIRREKIYILVGLCYNLLCLLMMNFAQGMLSPVISPLVPVLRDNFWLSTHVTCVILSYSALALSWVMANMVLIKKRFFRLSAAEFNHQADLIYTAIKFGVVLLAAGIILGGVWADYSWGRFWGWDPKETWSLIVLLIYMAILHGRYTSWISLSRFVPLVAGAFLSVLMAWFGVNYILASGLHSYGFSEGGAVFLGSVFLVQIALLILAQNKGRELKTH